MVDEMPLAAPPARRPLKRSASTASLPTPPRTHRKHARGRSRGSCDSDSDDNVALSSDDEEVIRVPNKKRRTGGAVDDNEEAFWLGGSAGLKQETATASSSKSSSTSSAPKQLDVPLLYRRLIGQTAVDVAPVSPPPSNRKSTVLVSPNLSDTPSPASPSTPCTPTTRSQKKSALRDSPNNPFLDTPQKQIGDDDTNSDSSPKSPVTERPTLTYVFRGVRRVYQNPLYNHKEDRPYSPPPASKLPIDDPEYSPAINCTPKLLFPEARRAKGKKPAPRNKLLERSPSLSGDEDGEDIDTGDIQPKLLNFGPPKNGTNTQTLDQELKNAGEPLSI